MASNHPATVSDHHHHHHQESVKSRHHNPHDASASMSRTPTSPRDAFKRSRHVVATGSISTDSSVHPPIASPTCPPTKPAAPPATSLPTIPGGNSDEDLSSRSSSSSDLTGPHPSATSDGTSPSPPSPTPSDPAPPNKKKQDESTRPRKTSASAKPPTHGRVRRLSAVDIQQLTSEAESLPVAIFDGEGSVVDLDRSRSRSQNPRPLPADQLKSRQSVLPPNNLTQPGATRLDTTGRDSQRASEHWPRPGLGRTTSTPPGNRKSQNTDTDSPSSSPRRNSLNPSSVRPPALKLAINVHPNADDQASRSFARPVSRPPSITTTQSQLRPFQSSAQPGLPLPSPMPPSIPLPPMSIPTHLQLELSTQRPSPLYIHQSYANEIPYESTAVKLERLKNVLVLPFYLERTLNFGALACLDAWLYNFTILPIRFCIAVGVLVKWWCYFIVKEAKWAVSYVWRGLKRRVWSRGSKSRRGSEQPCPECDIQQGAPGGRGPGQNETGRPQDVLLTQDERRRAVSSLRLRSDSKAAAGNGHAADASAQHTKGAHPLPHKDHDHNHSGHGISGHRRAKSLPSNLTNMHKADILLGGVIILSSLFLMRLDASRMYHVIRGQDAIKLYVIYNVLEVGDRLLSALGQDVFECLLGTETVSRTPAGRSKVLKPAGLFLLALAYNIIHSVALYYQVITLNVAVNSYSNALLTLLLSNQFVEVKSTVFKRFEKDNLFQLTCADISERFQLWLMLFIIGMRNVVEVGGLSIPGAGDLKATSTKPLHSPSILPHSFTMLPTWIWSGEVLSPFLIVIGSEILVDTIKHAYVNKFNKIRPTFYSRILDILSKDYYTNAFVTPSLTRRVGLAVAPLSCLFIRSSIQTYHMFLSSHVSVPIVESTQTSLSAESATPSSPVMLAALDRLDTLLRDALGRSVYGYPYGRASGKGRGWLDWTTDDVIAAVTMLVVFFIAFLVLLIVKILLGMALLRYSRNRYARMKVKEHLISVGQASPESYDAEGKRLGGYGHVEVTEEKRRWINADKDEGLKGKGRPDKSEKKTPEGEYQGVQRYEMVTKRIW
ncbi:DUF747-domain-containing protein [Sodiomyces alkalinus F11]|uniref:DUF747-domain-containing protein n=1 Tax=Sodiomyces alkalinus (strain CBS 110278 / VKM F-3762 / F11) TaxID=1314773 RepID=A0A3N2QAQ3_SODAK|nr:DUF747-domain-containing protein [Sodiomyces alkalinus F11]ROT43832.1 DUF747-domain-containing protein [Sodiomyces alkalinus F11]